MRLLLLPAVAVLLAGCGSEGKDDDTADPAPASDTRLLGLNQAAVEVPDSWATNESSCGTPMVDTVVVDVAASPLCYVPRPRGVESVQLEEARPRDFKADETVEIDGVRAERERTICEGLLKDEGWCQGIIWIPSESAAFRATSSTSKETVDELLAEVQIVPDRVGIPGFSQLDIELQSGASKKYADVLRAAGLDPRLVEEQGEPGLPAGYVLGASPSPGTMVEPGEKVTVRVAGAPKQ